MSDRLASDLVCWSHVRWGLVGRRHQRLIEHWAQTHRVFFVEEPLCDSGPARLEIRHDDSGVHVVVPHLEPDLGEAARSRELRRLCQRLFDEYDVEAPIAWTCLPTARRAPAETVVYVVA